MQTTVKAPVIFSDIGLHSGLSVRMVAHPAPADHGIVFKRTDITDRNPLIDARWDKVTETNLCTIISNEDGASVATLEHFMAACAAVGLDNALVEIDSFEVPIFDGSAVEYLKRIDAVGLTHLSQPKQMIKVLKDVKVEDGDKVVMLSPSDEMSFGGTIDFDHPAIGKQSFETLFTEEIFRDQLATARTFGFMDQLAELQNQGRALGGSTRNAIVLDDEKVLNKTGLRFKDEFIRHKLLDSVGDLYLAGMPIMGAYTSYKPGHEMNNKLLRAMFADQSCYEIVPYEDMHSLLFVHKLRDVA